MQTTTLSFGAIDYGPGGNSERITRSVRDRFACHPEQFLEARILAREVAVIVGRLDPIIERHTSLVCPQCTTVCCANRHSYHTHEDVVYLFALGEKVPAHDPGIGGSDPCQFMGDLGCSIGRVLRPHRCNSYFCTPLLEHMECGDAREYRKAVQLMRKLTDTRMAMLQSYAETSSRLCRGAGYDKIDF